METLKERIKAIGLKKKQIAKLMGIHHVYFSRLLSGKDPFTSDMISKLENILSLHEQK